MRVVELGPEAAARIRQEIARAGGNEVCFVAGVDDEGYVVDAHAVARGHAQAVLAAVRDAEPGSIVVHNHPGGDLTPSNADMRVAAALYDRGLGMAMTDNDARELYVVVEPPDPKGLEPLDEDEIAAVLGPDGPISRAHPAYEDRPAQRALARQIARAYNEGGVSIAEAGTGTGKSVAYLVPAIQWSLLNKERTVVSTNTINLQEQLVGKDLPFLRRALTAPFRYALVKGRHNYISIRRALLAAETAPSLFGSAEQTELDTLLTWVKSTRDGSLQDLPFEPSAELWDEVVSDSDVCMRARCPHFEQCFYQRARRDATAADVLVVNHHLLFSDIAVRRAQDNYSAPAVLPPYRRVILDEAHNLEDAATSHLGATVTRRGLLRTVGRLDRRGRGLLTAIEFRLLGRADDMIRQQALDLISETLRSATDNARARTDELFDILADIVARDSEGVIRLHDDFAGDPSWIAGPAPAVEGLLIALDTLARGLHRLREIVQVDRRWAEQLQQELVELHGVQGRVREEAGAARLTFQPGLEPVPMVRWLERRGVRQREARNAWGPPDVAACAAPVDLAELVRTTLLEQVHTTVLTSATLSTADGFGFIRARLGVGPGLRVTEESYPSPFDFERQTLVALATDLPGPRGESAASFDIATAAVVEDHARLCDGGLFVLFTSYRALRAVAAELRRRGVEGRWPLFVQGEAPRARLLERFTGSGRAILLGVSSFWEGVDVPGDPLRGLIITKLPFKVPSEPLTAARIEAIEQSGGNGFAELMLPLAALRLKQGFGRLIRSRSDRGAVVLLDRRLRDRGYGRYFLRALPPAPVLVDTWSALVPRLRAFYAAAAPIDAYATAIPEAAP
jgi:ATP-dependent DNA helicase DinG